MTGSASETGAPAPGEPGGAAPEGRRRWFLVALLAAAAFQALHVLLLPLVVTFDGQVYYVLAELFGRPEFAEEYDFVRTPLFPLLLRGGIEVLGHGPYPPLLLNAALTTGAVACLGLVARRLAGERVAAVAVLVLTLWPLSVAYQHTLLSESGTVACLALFVWTLVRYLERPGLARCLAAALAVALGYWFRPTLLYVAPCGALLALGLLVPRPGGGPRPRLGTVLGHAALLVLVPFLLSLPWRRFERPKDLGYIYVFGMVKQAVIEPGDEEHLGRLVGAYDECIERASPDGSLDWAGLLIDDVIRFLNSEPVVGRLPEGAPWFREVVARYPGRYLAGAWRTGMLFMGMRSLESENDFFVDLALADEGTETMLVHPRYLDDPVWDRLAKPPRDSLLVGLLRVLDGLWSWRVALFLSNCAALALLAVGLARRELLTCVLPAFVLYFYVLHAVTLLAIDRYAFPAYALLQVVVVLAAARALGTARARRGGG